MTRATPHSFRQSPGSAPVTPLKVIFLADTRPGHYHLAEGVIAAVARLRPVEVTRIEVKRKWIVPTRWLRRRINAESFFPPRMLRMAYRIQADELPKADLVVSAGGETQMPNICVTRYLGVPNVFCGSLLRGLGAENFSLVISSYDRDAGSPRHMVLLKPSAIDPDALGRPAAVPRYGPDHRPKLAGLLIGGNAGPFRYRAAEWDRLLEFAKRLSKAWGTRWLVSTSRRTPDHVADKVAELAKDESVIARFIDYRSAGPGTLPEIFGKAEMIVCTEDFEHHGVGGRICTSPGGWRGAGSAPLHRRGIGLSGISRAQQLVPRSAHRVADPRQLRRGALRDRANQGKPDRRAGRQAQRAPTAALQLRVVLSRTATSRPL